MIASIHDQESESLRDVPLDSFGLETQLKIIAKRSGRWALS
ncbi:MAG: hypothetical protein ABI380_09495 [Edaphobacter sp.]